MSLVVAFSGGKDSTAMALRLSELGESFDMLFTPTGNELPELRDHVAHVAAICGARVVTPPGPTLEGLISLYGALPNHRMRWCTRQIKIQPCIAYLRGMPADTVLCVELRADEPERDGIYGREVRSRFPLREWGWRVADVVAYCKMRGIEVPIRTDCAWCYEQRIGEWRWLWRTHPTVYLAGEAEEDRTGHTFRSPTRDDWPAGLRELRGEFERGRKLRGDGPGAKEGEQACRVCRL